MVYKIAIIGATGVVGRTVLKIMFERNLLSNDIHIFAERREKGKKIVVGKRKFVVTLHFFAQEKMFQNDT